MKISPGEKVSETHHENFLSLKKKYENLLQKMKIVMERYFLLILQFVIFALKCMVP